MLRAGRPRKTGVLREPNGRASRTATRQDFSQSAWAARLAGLNDALRNDHRSSVLKILERLHPIGHMHSRGEIGRIEFYAAMAYFAAVMAGYRLDELRIELSKCTGLDFSPDGCWRIKFRGARLFLKS